MPGPLRKVLPSFVLKSFPPECCWGCALSFDAATGGEPFGAERSKRAFRMPSLSKILSASLQECGGGDSSVPRYEGKKRICVFMALKSPLDFVFGEYSSVLERASEKGAVPVL